MFINNLLKITAGDGVDITSSGKKRYSCLHTPQEHTLGDVVSLTMVTITIVIL